MEAGSPVFFLPWVLLGMLFDAILFRCMQQRRNSSDGGGTTVTVLRESMSSRSGGAGEEDEVGAYIENELEAQRYHNIYRRVKNTSLPFHSYRKAHE